MKQLTKVESIVLLLGAILMVAGSAANVFFMPWAPYMFVAGTLAFVLMQFKQSYKGCNPTIIRLRSLMIFSDILFLVSAFLMVANVTSLLPIDYLSYLRYVHNNWVVTLLIGALLQLYVSHRIDRELRKEKKKKTKSED